MTVALCAHNTAGLSIVPRGNEDCPWLFIGYDHDSDEAPPANPVYNPATDVNWTMTNACRFADVVGLPSHSECCAFEAPVGRVIEACKNAIQGRFKGKCPPYWTEADVMERAAQVLVFAILARERGAVSIYMA